MADSARAIIHYPYENKYNSVLLVRDSTNQRKQFALPGGQFDSTQDRNIVDTLHREVYEELGLDIGTYRFLRDIPGAFGRHHIFVAEARGTLDLDHVEKQNAARQRRAPRREVDAVGFYGSGRGNMIPESAQQGHLKALPGLYRWDSHWSPAKQRSDIFIPGGYLTRWEGIVKEWRDKEKQEGQLPRDGGGGWGV